MKSLKDILLSESPEHTYLSERLQSAKWLGWEMPQQSATTISVLTVTKTNPDVHAASEQADINGEFVQCINGKLA